MSEGRDRRYLAHIRDSIRSALGQSKTLSRNLGDMIADGK